MMNELTVSMSRSRKRPRKWIGTALVSLSVLVIDGIDSFELGRSWMTFGPHRRNFVPVLYQASSSSFVAEISTVTTGTGDAAPTLTLPPWLASSFEYSLDEIRLKQKLHNEWEFLYMELEDQGWNEAEIEGTLDAITATCSNNKEWMLGCLEFLQTLLQLPELATPIVVRASIVHYFECVIARQNGIYTTVRQRLLPDRALNLARSAHPTVIDMDLVQDSTTSKTQLLAASNPSDKRKLKRVQRRNYRRNLKQQLLLSDDCQTTSSVTEPTDATSPFSEEVLELAQIASQIKRAEIVSEVVLARNRPPDHDKLQNLLVSVGGEDWRALAIRCIASLYRLQASDPFQRLPDSIAAARSAMHVYAPLAQRMGLHGLKTRLENKAFYYLYPRQYKAAVAIFEHQGDSMKAVEQYLQQQIWHLLQQDPNLKQVEWQVTARVKEPYSLWKKLLRKSMPRTMHWMLHQGGDINTSSSSTSSRENGGELVQSMLRIRDGVALRIIVKSLPIPGESDNDRQTRDQVTCYYVHQLVRSVFPESNSGHVKDYIANPKPNGYQSLHHTSSLRMNQLEIPFEIQVRSQDMHRVAEFGVAAHWEYKRAPSPTRVTLSQSSAITATQRNDPQEGQTTGSATVVNPTSANPSTTPYLQALEVARQSLVQSSVFVFLAGTSMEHGQLVSVHKGERIMDIWRSHVVLTANDHSNSNDMPTVWRNGRLAELQERVQNGDVLLFQQQKEKALLPRKKVLKTATVSKR